MAVQRQSILSLFHPSENVTGIKRTDSGASDTINQLQSFNFEEAEQAVGSIAQTVTVTLTPSHGSTCISLYPRTKTFTLQSQVDDATCIATDEITQTWRISTVAPQSDVDRRRYSFERLSAEKQPEVVEAFRRCSVAASSPVHRRTSSQERFRKMSVGHFCGLPR